MSESEIAVLSISTFMGLVTSSVKLREFKKESGSGKKVILIAAISLMALIFFTYKYFSVVDSNGEFIQQVKPLMFGGIAGGVFISCSLFKLMKSA